MLCNLTLHSKYIVTVHDFSIPFIMDNIVYFLHDLFGFANHIHIVSVNDEPGVTLTRYE